MFQVGERGERIHSTWSVKCTEEACSMCGKRRVMQGSHTWSGTGIFAYLQDDTREAPPPGKGVGHFKNVPRPPEGWMTERFDPSDLINSQAFTQSAAPGRAVGRGGDVVGMWWDVVGMWWGCGGMWWGCGGDVVGIRWGCGGHVMRCGGACLDVLRDPEGAETCWSGSRRIARRDLEVAAGSVVRRRS